MKSQTDITHLQAQKLLQLSLDGPLDKEQAWKIQQHLKDCAECRKYAAEMKIMVDYLSSSLQERWPPMNVNDAKTSSAIANTLSKLRNDNNKRLANTTSNVGWIALVVLLISGLVWSIKTFSPVPNQIPAVVSSPEPTTAILLPSNSPLPTLEVTSQEPLPTHASSILPSLLVSLMPMVNFTFASKMPSSPKSMTIYQ